MKQKALLDDKAAMAGLAHNVVELLVIVIVAV